MNRFTAICVIVLGVVLYSNAQTKTVTNFDLEKFKTARLAAEKDLKDNYAKLGFPSQEELEKQRDKDTKDRIALGEKLLSDRLERQRAEAEAERMAYAAAAAAQPNVIVINSNQGYGSYPYWSGGYGGYYGGRFGNRFPGRFPIQHNNFGWRAGGGMIMYNGGGNSNTNIGSPAPAPRVNFPRPTPHR